ncbi:MAG TPA: hypothetical protein VN258_07015 [Mobilitalea sp.]|nr:hypothetical protein [Mobilitalea sp.]
MTLQYAIVGGQLIFDKVVFAREVLMADSPLKVLMKTEEENGVKQPKITKTDSKVTIDYNDASDVLLDENFYDLLKKLKAKYQGKVTGRVVIRITALTSYHVILDLNYEDGRIVYE